MWGKILIGSEHDLGNEIETQCHFSPTFLLFSKFDWIEKVPSFTDPVCEMDTIMKPIV